MTASLCSAFAAALSLACFPQSANPNSLHPILVREFSHLSARFPNELGKEQVIASAARIAKDRTVADSALLAALEDPKSPTIGVEAVFNALAKRSYDFDKIDFPRLMRNHPPVDVHGKLILLECVDRASLKKVLYWHNEAVASGAPDIVRLNVVLMVRERRPDVARKIKGEESEKAVLDLLARQVEIRREYRRRTQKGPPSRSGGS